MRLYNIKNTIVRWTIKRSGRLLHRMRLGIGTGLRMNKSGYTLLPIRCSNIVKGNLPVRIHTGAISAGTSQFSCKLGSYLDIGSCVTMQQLHISAYNKVKIKSKYWQLLAKTLFKKHQH